MYILAINILKSVSYTHLDVYKRQELKPKSYLMEQVVVTAERSDANIHNAETVSYTHLFIIK